MKANFDELDPQRLELIKKQAQYRKTLTFQERFELAMAHLEGLRQLRFKARRIPNEKI